MEKKEYFAILRYAGAFIAWVIGSGFATGQELLQFFSSYGQNSYLVLAVNLIGFLLLGVILVRNGFDHREESGFDHFRHACGGVLGRVYAAVVPVTLVLIIAVLFSACGATLEQYFGLDRFIGSGIMAALVLAVCLAGFERMVQVVSAVSPLVILFTVFVGGYTVFHGIGSATGGEQAAALVPFQAAPHWSVSAVLYLSLNFLSGSIYYTELGRKAVSRRSAVWGAALGAVVLVTTIFLMSVAILQNGGGVAEVSVPTLYLAQRIGTAFGGLFSVVLMLGMFVSCSTTVWSFCGGFFKNDPWKNRLFTVGAVVGCFLLGLFPFGKLMSVVYPLIGYFGLPFIIGTLLSPLLHKKNPQKTS